MNFLHFNPLLAHPRGYLGHGVDRVVDMLVGIERPDREAHRALEFGGAELLMHQRRAVQAGPGGDIVIDIEPGANIGRVHTLDIHGDCRKMILQVIATIDPDALDLLKSINQPACQAHFLAVDTFNSRLVYPILSGPEGSYADHVGCAILHAVGVALQMVGVDRINPRAAGACMTDFDIIAHAKPADTGTSHKRLVAGERDDIDIHLFHVDRDDACCLRRIGRKQYIRLLAYSADFLERLDRAQDVGAVIDHDKFRIFFKCGSYVIRIDKTVGIEWDIGNLNSMIADKMIYWSDNGVVLQVGRNDMVAWTKEPPDDEVESVGGIISETEAFGGLGVSAEKFGQALAKVLDNVAGLDCQIESGAAGIDTAALIKIDHEFIDRFGFRPGGGRVIEVN